VNTLSWLTWLGVDTRGFDRWELIWPGLESKATLALAALALIAAALWLRSSVRDLASRPRRWFLLVWQLLALALLTGLMLRPAIQLARVARVTDRVAVAIDASASMTLPGAGGGARSAEAFAFLRKNAEFLGRLEREFLVSYYVFDRDLRELSGRPAEEVKGTGKATDLVAAISGAGAAGAAPLAGVIVISDGADTTRLGERFRSGKGEESVKALLADFPAPINTVLCGGGGEIRDLAIVQARHDDYGFVHNPFEVLVKVRSEGGLVTQAPVVFKQGEKVLASKTIALAPGQTEAEATLSFTPRQVGEFMFSVEIPAVAGELTAANNVVRFPLKVLRDKVRILYLCGNPSWDERFLRQTLKKDPAVDLISFYILREYWDNFQARQEEVSLIPFPTDELFTQELDTFDMVIWQNFRGAMYMPGNYSRYMGILNKYIRERGGALLMLGGHRAFFGRGLMDPMLTDLLPVVPDDRVPNYAEGEFKPGLTETGKRHPIMAVGEGGEDPAETIGREPALLGFNRVKQAAPDALTLAVHPFERGADGQLLPLIAVREVGAGRVAAVMTDYTWMWSLTAAGMGLSTKPYQRFWENTVRWLLQDPEMRLITFSAEQGRVAPGDPLAATIEVLDETYHPTDQAQVKVEVLEQPPGSNLQLPAPEPFGVGKYRLAVVPLAAGGYRLRASATLKGRELGHDDLIFEAAEESAEWRDVLPRPEILAELARASGGTAIASGGDVAGFNFKRSALEQVTGAREVPLWDNWVVFALVFVVLVLAWFLRRKWGLR
jgi:uncharacterized membrane protein